LKAKHPYISQICKRTSWLSFCLFFLNTSSISIVIPSIASSSTVVTSRIVIAPIKVVLRVVVRAHLAVVLTEIVFRIARFFISCTIGVVVVGCDFGGIVVGWELCVAVRITLGEAGAFGWTGTGAGGFGGRAGGIDCGPEFFGEEAKFCGEGVELV